MRRETNFAGREIEDYQPGELSDPVEVMPHLAVEYDSDGDIVEMFTDLLQQPDSDKLEGLSIGMWADEMYDSPPTEILEALIAAAPQLPSLKALFIGNMGRQENEVSWIVMTDLSPIWTAFPHLEHLRIRGSQGLSLGKIEHAFLQELTIECGGLPRSVLQELAAAKLPNLQHLELFLGEGNYGWDGQVEDVKPLLTPALFPKLKYLGLKDSEIQDEVAELIAKNPAMLEQLETLDLSLGTLSSRGGRALLNCTSLKKLKSLDLHHHYLTDEVVQLFRQLGIEVDLSEQEGQYEGNGDQLSNGYDDRYVAVSE